MARDFIHESVQMALEKDGWRITHDPFTIDYSQRPIDKYLQTTAFQFPHTPTLYTSTGAALPFKLMLLTFSNT